MLIVAQLFLAAKQIKKKEGSIMFKCGLASLAEKAVKMGYKNPNGTVNLFMAEEVIKKLELKYD